MFVWYKKKSQQIKNTINVTKSKNIVYYNITVNFLLIK